MDNTTVLTFTMTAYAVMKNYKSGIFTVFLLLYLLILTLNLVILMLIHQTKELHQPMNVFTFLLCLNQVYGSTALLPAVMALLLSTTYEMPVKCCLTQVYFLHTYASLEFCVLALMAYDRYLAICRPLHYHTIMSHSTMRKLVTLSVVYPNVAFLCYYSLTLQLTFCRRFIAKLYCVNMEVVKNSCSIPAHINIVGLLLILVLILPQLLMIIFSYVQISQVCRKLTRESQRRALKTCVPHLLSLLNYTIGSIFEISQTRFSMTHMVVEARIFMSLYFVILPSISNPVLYGLGRITLVCFGPAENRSKLVCESTISQANTRVVVQSGRSLL
ncbi:Olfactory receptor 51L1 [Takifugu flavidus]|uniref:Olfactory receptor n=1 Tax=Takifugu flavidus TaxID=433684 RepID=A0A5C6P7P8_9TELE|nr:Olfactory receptor 51L1 [Takifugu flavidus]